MNNNKLPKNAAAVQKFVEIKEIKEDVVIMKDNSIRSICICSSLNFDLLSTPEQEAVTTRFQEFLNSLDFSLQIFVASRNFNIDTYLSQIDELGKKQTDELLKIQTEEYVNFVRSFVDFANIMSKTFYAIIPFAIAESKQESFFTKLKNSFGSSKKPKQTFSMEKFSQYKAQLEQRVNMVVQGLQGLGIKAVPLNSDQLTELLYQSYNIGK